RPERFGPPVQSQHRAGGGLDLAAVRLSGDGFPRADRVADHRPSGLDDAFRGGVDSGLPAAPHGAAARAPNHSPARLAPAGTSRGGVLGAARDRGRGGQAPVTGVTDTAAVKVGLTLEVRTIIGVYYRQGAVRTGVAMSNLRTALAGDSLVVRSRLVQQGNAAYIGTVQGVLTDPTGATRGEFKVPIGVYYTMEPRYAMRIGALTPGRYWLKVKLTTEREDLGPEVLLPSAVARDSVEVGIP